MAILSNKITKHYLEVRMNPEQRIQNRKIQI